MDSNLSMLRYYKKHIFVLKDMLNKLDPMNDDFSPLLEIQKYIVERILNTECKYKKKKDELGKLKKLLKSRGNNKEKSKEIKSKISKVGESVNGYKYLLYLWRCFGDGIAFKFISKWNLKRLLYESNSPEIKQPPGFIGGKTGIKVEWSYIESAAAHKVPAILCDITNSIRHGDICLLGANDPFIIEVKSSKNKNKRVSRQIESIHNIHSYLENDEGNISGFDGMRRVDIPLEEKHHNILINEVISAAKNEPYSRISPEKGLYYIGHNIGCEIDFDEIFMGISEPIIFMLNQAKTDKRWDNYYPFTLSIQSAESLYSFINGEVYIIVVLDGAVLKNMAKNIGYDMKIVMSENVGFEFSKEVVGYNEPFISIASEQSIGRIALEFLSLEWFFKNEKHLLADIEKTILENMQNA